MHEPDEHEDSVQGYEHELFEALSQHTEEEDTEDEE